MAKKQNKITKYRRPLNLNIGLLIFSVIFIYMFACVIMYFRTSHIIRYEVQQGSLATNNIYRGIALRAETTVSTDTAGYVNYFAREGERVAKNDLVYVIDETGRLSKELADAGQEGNSLSEKELAEFRSEIVNFVHGYDSYHFEAAYDFKYSLKNTVLKLANSNMLQNIQDSDKLSAAGNVIEYCNAPVTGIVAYWTDGYETLTAEEVTEEVFDKDTYEKTQHFSNDLLAAGEVAYKLSTEENWSIVIPIEAETGLELEEEGYVKVRFLKNQYESWGKTKLLHNPDGKTYLQLSFTNSMISYIAERFLEIELITDVETGLKIPNSAIAKKEFYLIPEEFMVQGENEKNCIIRQCYLEDGTISSELLEVDVYSYDEEEKVYYLDASILNAGDIVHKEGGQDTYTVSRRAVLTGVYNMNKGYADFREIQILNQNEEYSIVKANTQYGLNVYDYIVLNAESVHDDQFINEAGK